MRRFFFLIFIVCSVLTIARYSWNTYSYLHWFESQQMGTVWTAAKERELDEIVNQSFHYLGHGSTSQVYVSDDGRFVIKTFLKEEFRSKHCKYIPFVRDLINKRKTLKMRYKRALGIVNAYQIIPKECAMVFYQLIRPRALFKNPLHLLGKDGSESWLDLNRSEYVIQKKAIIAEDYLKLHIAKGDLERAKSGITKLLEMTKTLYDQGIVLSVLQFRNNFGFLEDVPVRIDVEHLCFDPRWKVKGRKHLSKQLCEFRAWVAGNCPVELLTHLDSEIERCI